MGGTYFHTPQSIFQHSMNQQVNKQPGRAPWLQVPTVPPMSMPWSIPSLQQPDLVRFTGENSLFPSGPLIHQKRKLDEPDIVRPTKQLITEEKMSDYFKDLYISPSSNNEEENASMPSNTIQNTFNFDSNISTGKISEYPRLVLSDEVKNLKKESILPETLLSKLERPSMALVLWEPPQKSLRNIIPNLRTAESSEEEDSDSCNNNNNTRNNNNNDAIPDLNQGDVMNIDTEFEPMDL